MTLRLLFMLLILVLTPSPLMASDEKIDQRNAQGIEFFEAKIRPVLVKECYSCHSADAGKSKGGLLLDSRDGVRTGGDRGPAVVPHEPEASWLLTAISHTDPDLQMPPSGRALPGSFARDVKHWIAIGAPDPRERDAAADYVTSIDLEAGRRFWAFQTPKHPALPATESDWPRDDIDHFILEKLQEQNLEPAEDAAPTTLLRRIHFDLVGLPPSPADIDGFRNRIRSDGIDRALQIEVDALLASPRFGERWGRHWLDVARFAESSGKDTNVTFPHAWRYRDYVINSVNRDKPFDQFITEQIAGDLLPHNSPEHREELMVATGFLALGPKGLNEMNPAQFRADVVDEQIDTVTRAVMASSVACARCHDHKFDPYSMRDYYALAGIFHSSRTFFGTSVAPGNQVGGDLLVLPAHEGQYIPNRSLPAKRVAKLREELETLKQDDQEKRAAAKKAAAEGQDPNDFYTLADALRFIWRTGSIEGQLKTVDDAGNALPLAMGVSDGNEIRNAPVLERGEITRPGALVPRGFPEVIELEGLSAIPMEHSGRLELARWLTHPDHPLTARVMANRVWRHLLGEGLVRTVDNFGANGETPSHPELLDHLAVRFVDSGWSLKSLVRDVVLSRTYRQASTWRESAFQADPDNRLLWRASKRRLDAECIRDSMLAVAGSLDTRRPAGSLISTIGDRPVSIIAFDKRVPPDFDNARHRSVYLPVLRDRLPDVLELFDFAEPSLVTGDRETTNGPLQALYLMNSSFVQERAAELARRMREHSDRRDEQVQFAFQLCFGRPADDAELRVALAFLDAADDVEATKLATEETTKDPIDTSRLAQFCQSLLATGEFRNLD